MKNVSEQGRNRKISQFPIKERIYEDFTERTCDGNMMKKINPALFSGLQFNEYKALKKLQSAALNDRLIQYESMYLMGEGVEGVDTPLVRNETEDETAALKKLLRAIVQERIDDRIEEDTGLKKEAIQSDMYARLSAYLWQIERLKWFSEDIYEEPLPELIDETEDDGYVYNNLPESYLYILYRGIREMYRGDVERVKNAGKQNG